jgi:hypothetical protein
MQVPAFRRYHRLDSSFSMELCTASVSISPHRPSISTSSRPVPYTRYAGSRSCISKRTKRSSLYVINAASTNAPLSSRTLPTQTNGAAAKGMPSKKPNSALEQLDIERGVCVPFRKYSPEMVWRTTSICVYKVGLLKFGFNYAHFHN